MPKAGSEVGVRGLDVGLGWFENVPVFCTLIVRYGSNAFGIYHGVKMGCFRGIAFSR